ncbi:flavin-containing monooxygenase-related family protein [Striga asiatica]|uniref:Flavin-containing monooxygenase-related family protein n=1 Tax=Striga asiatica TaxID=4170 RepID=A0A5A7PPX4_STRAF|nr:flavin-containing monooxygenase-related family protein [Striga asiatica]
MYEVVLEGGQSGTGQSFVGLLDSSRVGLAQALKCSNLAGPIPNPSHTRRPVAPSPASDACVGLFLSYSYESGRILSPIQPSDPPTSAPPPTIAGLKHLDRNRGRPDGTRSDLKSHPLQPLRLATDELAPGGHGFPGLPVRGKREARERSEEVSGLGEVVRFRSEMSHVGFAEGRNWSVRSKIGNEKRGYDEVYDAVVVYNGHYTEPRVADIPGITKSGAMKNMSVPRSFFDRKCISSVTSPLIDSPSRNASRSLYTLLTSTLLKNCRVATADLH